MTHENCLKKRIVKTKNVRFFLKHYKGKKKIQKKKLPKHAEKKKF